MTNPTMLNLLIILLLSMVPTIEARFAIPYGILQNKLDPTLTFLFAILGTFLATIIVLAFLYLVVPKIKWKWLNNLLNKIFTHTRNKHSKKLESFKEISIITFVAVPFPGTGVYSGCIICYLMGVAPKRALLLNTIGMLISAAITLLGALGIIAIV